MSTLHLGYGLILASVLFALGLVGVLTRRNLVFVLMSLEVMLNAAALAFIVAGARWGQPDGQVMFLFIVVMAAAEVGVGHALVLRFERRHRTVNSDVASKMRG
jgi:NADH-quinone oxidoreductase subunit K